MNETPMAFPDPGRHDGMTLRDWFAGMALESMLRVPSSMPERAAEIAAIAAYRIADAMLAERERVAK